jgi:hypothetical protein
MSMLDITNINDAVTGQPVDPTFIEAMINRTLGEPVAIGGHVRVVDTSLQPVDMQIPHAEESNDLARMVYAQTASISCDVTQPVQRKIQFTMKDPLEEGQDLLFDPWNHFIQPSMTMSCLGRTVEFPLATYLMGNPRATISSGRRAYEFNGLDITALLSLADLLSDWTVTANYTGGHIQAVIDLMTAGSVPKSLSGTGQTPQGNDDAGPAWPSSVFEVDWSGNQAVGIPFPGRAGTNRVAFAADICGAINYFPIHLTNSTTVRFKRIPDYTISPPAISRDYSTTGESIITGTIDEVFDDNNEACNVARVEGGQANAQGGSTFTSVQINNTADSKLSYQNLKTFGGQPRAIGKYVSEPLLVNQAMTDLRAKLLLLMGSTLHDRVQMVTLPDPRTESYEYYELGVAWKDGTIMIASDATTPFLEVGWTLPFMSHTSRMSHSLVRAVGV